MTAAASNVSPSLADQRLRSLLERGAAERAREHKYRFSQAIVFGLPVVALQAWGGALGGSEAGRWVGILQGLLAGWVMYGGAAGMLFEGLVARRRSLLGDLLTALIALGLYVAGLVSVLHVLVDGSLWYRPLTFHLSVTVVAAYTGVQWFRWSRRARAEAQPRPSA